MTTSTDFQRLTIEFLIRQNRPHLGYAYTRGLWWLGIPELVITLPGEGPVRGEPEQSRIAVLLADGLIDLSRKLVQADDFTVPAYHGEIDGRPVRLWLGRPAPVEGVLSIALGEEVDTLLPVHVSLWDDPGG